MPRRLELFPANCLRKPGDVDDINPLVIKRLALFCCGLAIDAFRFGLAIMDFPCLLGKILADIAALGADLRLQRAHFIHQRLHLLRSFRRQGRSRNAARAGLSGRCLLA